MKAGERGRCCW